jgi:hypothetical protein
VREITRVAREEPPDRVRASPCRLRSWTEELHRAPARRLLDIPQAGCSRAQRPERSAALGASADALRPDTSNPRAASKRSRLLFSNFKSTRGNFGRAGPADLTAAAATRAVDERDVAQLRAPLTRRARTSTGSAHHSSNPEDCSAAVPTAAATTHALRSGLPPVRARPTVWRAFLVTPVPPNVRRGSLVPGLGRRGKRR